jgi:hypothetical protein
MPYWDNGDGDDLTFRDARVRARVVHTGTTTRFPGTKPRYDSRALECVSWSNERSYPTHTYEIDTGSRDVRHFVQVTSRISEYRLTGPSLFKLDIWPGRPGFG